MQENVFIDSPASKEKERSEQKLQGAPFACSFESTALSCLVFRANCAALNYRI
jgi:hypothetical protein